MHREHSWEWYVQGTYGHWVAGADCDSLVECRESAREWLASEDNCHYCPEDVIIVRHYSFVDYSSSEGD